MEKRELESMVASILNDIECDSKNGIKFKRGMQKFTGRSIGG